MLEARLASPLPYHPELTPRPSPLRPHVLAKDRLCMWLPDPASDPTPVAPPIISQGGADRIRDVLSQSWHDSTRATYGAGLAVFHVFCDRQEVPEHLRCPAPPVLILSFVASCAGFYSGSTVANYAAGLRAWHTLHGRPWLVDPTTLKRCLEGAVKLAPASSKRLQRAPITVEIIVQFRSCLRLDEPLDAAIFACLTTCFWCIARLGEFTVPAIKNFSPARHITRADVATVQDRHALTVLKFNIPFTKTSASTGKGESVQCAKQDGLADPISALENHFRVNPGRPSDHLFAWKHADGSLHPLSRRQFLSRFSALAKSFNLPNIKGHSLRIGGTLEYLLRGVPFEVVQSQGRWAGQAFTLYLRKHAMILAPYLQASPAMEPFTHYSQPPVR